jgi:hypothetical protein
MAGLIEQYAGRSVDLLVFQPQADVPERLMSIFDATGGYACAGIEKLVQRFLLHLLTAEGSSKYFPSKGCKLMTTARRGSLRTVSDVSGAFLLSMSTIKANMRSEESSTDPADERLSECLLRDVELENRVAKLTLEIVSVAGTSRTVIAPVSFMPVS